MGKKLYGQKYTLLTSVTNKIDTFKLKRNEEQIIAVVLIILLSINCHYIESVRVTDF